MEIEFPQFLNNLRAGKIAFAILSPTDVGNGEEARALIKKNFAAAVRNRFCERVPKPLPMPELRRQKLAAIVFLTHRATLSARSP